MLEKAYLESIPDLIVAGAGPAGIFAAISAKTRFPQASVIVLEKTRSPLAKILVSGGGRCNATHANFDPAKLASCYPRGHKELIGAFHRFQPRDMIDWFQSRGVPLKTERDGRMFPTTDSSQTIFDCLLDEAKRLEIEIRLNQSILDLEKESDCFKLFFADGQTLRCRKFLIATGSSRQGHAWSHKLGHRISPPVPSLFTLNIPDFSLGHLSGSSVQDAKLAIPGFPFSQRGPLLITHFGFSGPCALKLSAWNARHLFESDYKKELIVDWHPASNSSRSTESLISAKEITPNKLLGSDNSFDLPRNLWKSLAGSLANLPYRNISNKDLKILASRIHRDLYAIDGKALHKEEFVTCGGVVLSEIYFKTMESKVCPGLFFAGEVLDIDGITGGFNFQNAWTTGFIAGTSSLTPKTDSKNC